MNKKSYPNETIELLLNHKSIRKYKKDVPSEEMIDLMVQASQQAAFAGQLGSILLSRDSSKHPFGAPLYFIFLIDIHRMELVMKKRGWKMKSSDEAMLMFGMQDASYMAQNLVVAAESLGLGTCYLGFVPFAAENLRKKYNLPERVFPMVGVTVGFPNESPAMRPRYPKNISFFEGKYPELTDEMIEAGMKQMDEGYLAQDYYKNLNAMIKLEEKEESYNFATYSWTEHISRKWGQWLEDSEELLKPLRSCGFMKKEKE